MAANSKAGIRLFVYALCEPDGKTIRYIGVTANLWRRLHQHYQHSIATEVREWVWSLRKRGLFPAMIVLREVVGVEAGVLAEKEEIASHMKAGAALLNRQDTGKPRAKRASGKLVFGGKSMTRNQWAEHLGISRQALSMRLQQHPVAVALSRGKDQTKPLSPGRRIAPTQPDHGSEEVVVECYRQVNLSHAERRERRRAMASEYASGVLRAVIAEKYGVCIATVQGAIEEFAAEVKS